VRHGELAPDPYHPDDPHLLAVTMDMGQWLRWNPCPCEARCECDD
jgi:hypothetical protein